VGDVGGVDELVVQVVAGHGEEVDNWSPRGSVGFFSGASSLSRLLRWATVASMVELSECPTDDLGAVELVG
jgi:hypothetical protein